MGVCMDSIESWGRIPANMMRDKRLAKNDIIIYCYLSMIQGTNKNAYPSLSTIADFLGLYNTAISRSLKRLEKYNWIKVERRGGKKVNIYETLNQPITENFMEGTKRGEHLKNK